MGKIFGDLVVDFGTIIFEHLDRWGQYFGCWDDWIEGSWLGENLVKAWSDLEDATSFWEFFFPHMRQRQLRLFSSSSILKI